MIGVLKRKVEGGQLTLINIIFFLGFVETVILFLYAVRWYIFSFVSFKAKGSLKDKLEKASRYPADLFVSILLPVYNEPNVIDRLLEACTSFNSPEYEVVVIDDSNDGVTTRRLEKWNDHPKVRTIHRDSRRGWKAGAMNAGLDVINPESSHVLIFDADFIPPSNLVSRFVTRFKNKEVVAVQGYQRHDLNTDENWITKGVRVWHSMYNMVELNGKQELGLFSPLSGSVAMFRADVLRKLRFHEVTDEDWNLTLRLYENGYKIHYDPTLAASGECPNTLRGFFKQYSRWAEGHTRTFRDHFWKILKCKSLGLKEKIDFLFTGYCFLHSIMVIVLLIVWLITLFFPTSPMPLSLVIAETLLLIASIPAAVSSSYVALSLEGAKNDWRKIGYAWLLNFIVMPIIAFAALKGLVTRKGVFNRTHKTGKITKEKIRKDK